MHWIAPSKESSNNAALEKRLWDAADQFHTNSGLKPNEYSAPVLAYPEDRLFKWPAIGFFTEVGPAVARPRQT